MRIIPDVYARTCDTTMVRIGRVTVKNSAAFHTPFKGKAETVLRNELHFEIAHEFFDTEAEVFVTFLFTEGGHDAIAVMLQHVTDARRVFHV